MTKKQFIAKYDLTQTIKADLEAVIADEVAKATETKPKLNPINAAYERGEKIKSKTGEKSLWYQIS